jgi:hypothetical protein
LIGGKSAAILRSRRDGALSEGEALKRRLPFLAGVDLILIIYFPLAALFRYSSDHALYRSLLVAVSLADALFVGSLAFLKLGRVKAASYLGSLGILAEVLLLAAVVADALVSVERRQVVVYMAASLAVYAIVILLVALPAMGELGEAIKANDATVRGQASEIRRFTEGMDGMTGEVRSSFEGLGTMMDGLVRMETSIGTLSDSTIAMLRLAGDTKSCVTGVEEGLRSGVESATSAKDFASSLSLELSGILEAFEALDAAIEKAASIGELSLSRFAGLDEGLADAERLAATRTR